MSFAIFSDSACNLPRAQLEEFQVQIIPFSYERDGMLVPCPPDLEKFDGREYYDYLRNGGVVKTSLIPAARLEEAFRPVLSEGRDILYVTISSGISGTVASGLQAAQSLQEEFPDRQVRVLDSLGAGFGVGLLLGRAADCRKAGMSLEETYAALEQDRSNLCEFFTVDDLMFLRRTGRVSGVAATLGTMLQLKPLLRGTRPVILQCFTRFGDESVRWTPWRSCTGSGCAVRRSSGFTSPMGIAWKKRSAWPGWSGGRSAEGVDCQPA